MLLCALVHRGLHPAELSEPVCVCVCVCVCACVCERERKRQRDRERVTILNVYTTDHCT